MHIKCLFFAVLLITTEIFSQTLIISGEIKDAQSGEALPYGNVRVINTKLGTAANANGAYEIKLNSGNYSLVASYIGYYSDTVTVELKDNLAGVDFILRKTEILLPEIVIRPGENPALEIIRKAIEKKNERNSKLNSYEFEAYTKGLVRTTDEISARGRTVSAGIGTDDDSVDLKITGLLENQSRG
ncbi:MAG TPA: carboxypeptidase-like regulatory domain-containing protein, partial [Ignavibacteriaceae bacterium]